MTTIYVEEIFDDDEPADTHHEGTEVQQMQPMELPVHVLTSDMVAAAAAAPAAATASVPDPEPTEPKAAAAAAAAATAAKERGNQAFAKGRFDEALAAYCEAITLDDENGLLWGNRSAAQLQLGRPAEALDDARRMVSLLPELPKSHFRLGQALEKGGQSTEAAAAYCEALRLDPSSDASAGALRRAMDAAKLKKDPKLTRLHQQCQAALAAAKAHAKVQTAAKAAPAKAAPAPVPQRRLLWRELPCALRPPKRGGATLSAFSGRLWLIGGADRTGAAYANVWEYMPTPLGEGGDAAEGSAPGWREHSTQGFSARINHAAAAVTGAGALHDGLCVFGGQEPRSGKLSNELLRLTVPSDYVNGAPKWEVAVLEGDVPQPRNGHSLTHWPALQSEVAEAPRPGASMAANSAASGAAADSAAADSAAGGALLLFGGANDEGLLAELHELRPIASGGWHAAQPQCTGAAPEARDMHVAALVSGGEGLLVQGGRGGAEGELVMSDAHVLCLRGWVWSALGNSAWPRVGHALAPVLHRGGVELLFFGGLQEAKTCNDAWRLHAPEGGAGAAPRLERMRSSDEPSRRFAHAAAGLGERIFVFGGSGMDDELADLHQGVIRDRDAV